MKAYAWSIILAFLISIVIGFIWYLIFGYDINNSIIWNLYLVIINISFWKSVLIWTLLYSLFVTAPLTFLKKRKNNN